MRPRRFFDEAMRALQTGWLSLFLWPRDDDALVEALWNARSRDEIRRLLIASRTHGT